MHDDPVLGTIELIVALLGALTLVAMVVRRGRLPLSVALVVFGLIVAAFSPSHITVTPDLVLVALLPGLVFEAAFRLHLSDLRDVVGRIAVLAVPGVLVTSVVVAVVLEVATGLPFTVAFVVGAIVSATDPVAVVATMRDVAAPRRLATLVEAESLFNDGTGIVLFAIALAAVGAAYDPVSGGATFAVAIVSSIAIGAVSGFVAVRLASIVDDHLVEITLTFVVAYGTYLIANGLGQSGVIATVVAGIVLGSDAAQAGVSERTRQAIDTVWEYVAFVLTAFAFLLIGLSIVISDLVAAAGSIVWGIVAIIIGRAIVVYGILGGLRWLAARTTGDPATAADDDGTSPAPARRTRWPEWGLIAAMPTGWFHVLFWSGLRGAVAFALVLSLPLDVPQRGVVTSTVFGIVLFTLLVQGTTAARVIAWAGVEREPAPDAADAIGP
jgi:monovalent cation:H+ antiporter, CPA1 family